MNIVIGSGKRRKVISLPCGELIAASAKSHPQDYKDNLGVLTNLILYRI